MATEGASWQLPGRRSGSFPAASQEEGESVQVDLGVPDRLGRPAGARAEWAAGTQISQVCLVQICTAETFNFDPLRTVFVQFVHNRTLAGHGGQVHGSWEGVLDVHISQFANIPRLFPDYSQTRARHRLPSPTAMAPKRARVEAVEALVQRRAAKKQRGAKHEDLGNKQDSAQIVASQDVMQALACALGKNIAEMAPLRKTTGERNEQVAAIYDAIRTLKGCNANAALKEFSRLCEHYPEVAANCRYLKFAGAGQRETPVADAKTLVQIILLLPGELPATPCGPRH